MTLSGILIPPSSFCGFPSSRWLKNWPLSSSSRCRLRNGSDRVAQITFNGDLYTKIPYLVDKRRRRRLACCQISYRIRQGNDRQIRPAKRLWLLLPSGTLCHRYAGELPIGVWQKGGIKTGSSCLLPDLGPSFSNRPLPHAVECMEEKKSAGPSSFCARGGSRVA
jgi:hypothetical protein